MASKKGGPVKVPTFPALYDINLFTSPINSCLWEETYSVVPLAKTIVTFLHEAAAPVKSFRAFTAVEGFGAAAPPPPALGAEEAFGAADAAGAARARFRASRRFSRRTGVGVARVRQRRAAVSVEVVSFIFASMGLCALVKCVSE